jgi:hypothetical protein
MNLVATSCVDENLVEAQNVEIELSAWSKRLGLDVSENLHNLTLTCKGRRVSRPDTSQNNVVSWNPALLGRNVTVNSVVEFGQTMPSAGST